MVLRILQRGKIDCNVGLKVDREKRYFKLWDCEERSKAKSAANMCCLSFA
jgi:hypothetical protein